METCATIEVILLVSIAVVTIGIDLYLNFAEPENTFSALARAWARLSPFWPWTWGLLAGRFFHWGQQPILPEPMGIIGAGVITFGVCAFFSWGKVWLPIRSNFGIPGAFVLGYLVGCLFWPVDAPPIAFG